MKKFINSYRAQNTRNDYYEPTTNSNPSLDNSKRLDIVFLKRGTVYWYEETLTKEISDYLRMCGYTTGSRPVIVYQNIDVPRTGVTIIPLTRSETVKNGVPVDIERGSTSIALVPEIRCVPIKSLVKYIGVINEDKMQEIDKAVRTFHGSIDDVDTDHFPRRWTYMTCGIDMGHAADNYTCILNKDDKEKVNDILQRAADNENKKSYIKMLDDTINAHNETKPVLVNDTETEESDEPDDGIKTRCQYIRMADFQINELAWLKISSVEAIMERYGCSIQTAKRRKATASTKFNRDIGDDHRIYEYFKNKNIAQCDKYDREIFNKLKPSVLSIKCKMSPDEIFKYQSETLI